MRRTFLALTLIALTALPLLASAQQENATPASQTVTVGTLSYTIDPFYVTACFQITDDSHREWNGSSVDERGDATMQCFYRDKAGAMKAWPSFPTTNDGVLEHAELGQPMYGYPQTAMEPTS